MPREFGRNKRVGDQVQRELAVMIQREQTLPGLHLVTVSSVEVSPDLVNAKVFVTSLDADADKQQVVDALNELAGHFRHLLSKKLTLRIVPRLKFKNGCLMRRKPGIPAAWTSPQPACCQFVWAKRRNLPLIC
jgi:ribosome-binding factor A